MNNCIYIIKNSVNDKIYVGQTKNVQNRWVHHKYDAKYEITHNKCSQPLHEDMIKYGVDKFYLEIIEENVTNLDERERYWIKFYNSQIPNGYNIAPGGKGTGAGLDSLNSKFASREELLECISEISATNKSFENIAKKYNCGTEVISAINMGHRYKQEGLVYPLRESKKYSDEKVKQIRYSLKYEQDLTNLEIAAKYNVDASQVSLINQGRIYYLSSESYPLKKKRKRDLSEEDAKKVINDIRFSDLCMTDIAKKYNLSRSCISSVNYGVHHKNPSLAYPLRKENDPRNNATKRLFEPSEIKRIHMLLRGTTSIKTISQTFGVTPQTINRINSGQTKKYRIDGTKYPIREIS